MKGYKFIGLANNPRAKRSRRLRALFKQRARIEAAKRTATAKGGAR